MTSLSITGTRATDQLTSERLAVQTMAQDLELPDALLGGTQAMRRARTKYLPPEPGEDGPDYTVRIDRSFLRNFYKRSLMQLTARPFVKPVTLNEEPDGTLAAIYADTDLEGSSLTEFAREQLRRGIHYGMSHIWVENAQDTGGRRLDIQQDMGVRPYFVHITPTDLIGVTVRDAPNGAQRIISVRWRESRLEAAGTYGEELVDYIRIVNSPEAETGPTWELHRRVEGENWVLWEAGTHQFPGLPLVTWYTMRTGYLSAEPAFKDLAEINLAHWQSYSDLRNLLRFASIPILAGTGLSPEESEGVTKISPNRMLKSKKEEARFYYVEHSGSAIGVGMEHLDRLEAWANEFTQSQLDQRTGTVTATADAIAEAKTMSNMQCWVRSLELALEQAYRMAAIYTPLDPLHDDFAVDIFSEFTASHQQTDRWNTLERWYSARILDRATVIKKGIKTDLLDETDDAEEIALAIESERDFAIPTFGEEPEDFAAQPARSGNEPMPVNPSAPSPTRTDADSE
jgi:hypothetical protein